MLTETIKLLDVQDVAGILGYTKETVTRLIRQGKLKHHGNHYENLVRYFVTVDDLWDFIAGRRYLRGKITREQFDEKIKKLFAE